MQNVTGQYGPVPPMVNQGAYQQQPEPSPNNASTTSTLRQFRKKDLSNLEKSIPDNQNHIARVAPHNHFPPQKNQNEYFRYHRQNQHFADYGIVSQPTKFQDLSEQILAKNTEKNDICAMNQNHLKNHFGEHLNQNGYGNEMMQNNMQYIQKDMHQMQHGYPKHESQYFQQKDSNFQPVVHPQIQKYQIQPQIRKYQTPQNNDFLSKLRRIHPDVARNILNEHQLQESVQNFNNAPLYQNQRYYSGTYPPQQNYYGPYPPCLYNRQPRPQNVTNIPQNPHLFNNNNMYNYNNYEYAQHYQHRRPCYPHNQQYIPQHPQQVPTVTTEMSENRVPTSDSLKKFIENWGAEEENEVIDEHQGEVRNQESETVYMINASELQYFGENNEIPLENCQYVRIIDNSREENQEKIVNLHVVDNMDKNEKKVVIHQNTVVQPPSNTVPEKIYVDKNCSPIHIQNFEDNSIDFEQRRTPKNMPLISDIFGENASNKPIESEENTNVPTEDPIEEIEASTTPEIGQNDVEEQNQDETCKNTEENNTGEAKEESNLHSVSENEEEASQKNPKKIFSVDDIINNIGSKSLNSEIEEKVNGEKEDIKEEQRSSDEHEDNSNLTDEKSCEMVKENTSKTSEEHVDNAVSSIEDTSICEKIETNTSLSSGQEITQREDEDISLKCGENTTDIKDNMEDVKETAKNIEESSAVSEEIMDVIEQNVLENAETPKEHKDITDLEENIKISEKSLTEFEDANKAEETVGNVEQDTNNIEERPDDLVAFKEENENAAYSEENISKPKDDISKSEENTSKFEENISKFEENTDKSCENPTPLVEIIESKIQNELDFVESTEGIEENTSNVEENVNNVKEDTSNFEKDTNSLKQSSDHMVESISNSQETVSNFEENTEDIKDETKVFEESTNTSIECTSNVEDSSMDIKLITDDFEERSSKDTENIIKIEENINMDVCEEECANILNNSCAKTEENTSNSKDICENTEDDISSFEEDINKLKVFSIELTQNTSIVQENAGNIEEIDECIKQNTNASENIHEFKEDQSKTQETSQFEEHSIDNVEENICSLKQNTNESVHKIHTFNEDKSKTQKETIKFEEHNIDNVAEDSCILKQNTIESEYDIHKFEEVNSKTQDETIKFEEHNIDNVEENSCDLKQNIKEADYNIHKCKQDNSKVQEETSKFEKHIDNVEESSCNLKQNTNGSEFNLHTFKENSKTIEETRTFEEHIHNIEEIGCKLKQNTNDFEENSTKSKDISKNNENTNTSDKNIKVYKSSKETSIKIKEKSSRKKESTSNSKENTKHKRRRSSHTEESNRKAKNSHKSEENLSNIKQSSPICKQNKSNLKESSHKLAKLVDNLKQKAEKNMHSANSSKYEENIKQSTNNFEESTIQLEECIQNIKQSSPSNIEENISKCNENIAENTIDKENTKDANIDSLICEKNVEDVEQICSKIDDHVDENIAIPENKTKIDEGDNIIAEMAGIFEDTADIIEENIEESASASNTIEENVTQYRNIIKIEESTVLLEIAGILVEINVNNVNGKKVLNVIPVSNQNLVDFNDNTYDNLSFENEDNSEENNNSEIFVHTEVINPVEQISNEIVISEEHIEQDTVVASVLVEDIVSTSKNIEETTKVLCTKAARKCYEKDLQIPNVTTTKDIEENVKSPPYQINDVSSSKNKVSTEDTKKKIRKRSKRISDKQIVKEEKKKIFKKLIFERREKKIKNDTKNDDEYVDFKELLRARKLKKMKKMQETKGVKKTEETSKEKVETDTKDDSKNVEESKAKDIVKKVQKKVTFEDEMVTYPEEKGPRVISSRDPRRFAKFYKVMVPSVCEMITHTGNKRKLSLDEYNKRKKPKGEEEKSDLSPKIINNNWEDSNSPKVHNNNNNFEETQNYSNISKCETLESYKEKVDSKLSTLNISIPKLSKTNDNFDINNLFDRFLYNEKLKADEIDNIRTYITYKRLLENIKNPNIQNNSSSSNYEISNNSSGVTKLHLKKVPYNKYDEFNLGSSSDTSEDECQKTNAYSVIQSDTYQCGVPKLIIKRKLDNTQPVVRLQRLDEDVLKKRKCQ